MADRDPPHIDLEPGEYRGRLPASLLPRKLLWQGVIWLGLATVGGAYAASSVAAWWAGFLPVPAAIGLGIAVAALFPNWFFRDTD